MSETFKKVLLALIILIFVPVWVPIVLQLAGFYVNQPGWKVAEVAAKNKDVKLCSKIWIMPWKAAFSPSSFDQMETCIHEYASITHDPTVCELLMPSDYGWSCLGTARKEGDACDINYNRDVTWTLGSVYDTPYRATIKECKEGIEKTKKGKDCCYILQLTSEPDINDCYRFQANTPFMNLCLSQLAMKQKKAEICAGISDDNKRVICELQAKWVGVK